MNFEVKVVTLSNVQRHENADRLDVAQVAGYRCVVLRDQFQAGDPVVYIPEGSIVPQALLEEMGLWDAEAGKGKLAGPQGVRLKAARLRGVVSQGLVLAAPAGLDVGDDVAEHYGITKYVPEIPTNMAGQAAPTHGLTPAYDVENILSHPDALETGTSVVYTEKLHGTLASYGYIPSLANPALINGNVIVASKGLTGNMSFTDCPENTNNLYVRTFREKLQNTGIWDRVEQMAGEEPLIIFGEIFGRGVQDLDYGLTKEKAYRVFDIYRGEYPMGHYLDFPELKATVESLGLEMVPVLYTGPHSEQTLLEYRDGRETISGSHAREGIVITPLQETETFELERVKLKAVSPDHMFRGGAQTEFN